MNNNMNNNMNDNINELTKIERDINKNIPYYNRNNETNPMYGIARCFTKKKDWRFRIDKLHIDKYSNNFDELVEESKKKSTFKNKYE
jgi:hypothetical protein